jgi:hypothetical protein
LTGTTRTLFPAFGESGFGLFRRIRKSILWPIDFAAKAGFPSRRGVAVVDGTMSDGLRPSRLAVVL